VIETKGLRHCCITTAVIDDDFFTYTVQYSSILTMVLQTLGIYEYVDDIDRTNDNNKGGNDNDNEFNDDEVVDDLPEHGPGMKTI
jgi:hypothetical protein